MLALTLSILAAAPLPRVPARADFTVFVPRLDKLDGVGAFAAKAGERSVMVRVSSWAPEFHPLISVDPTRADSLKSAGFDPAGEATVSWVGEGKWSCVALSDPALFQTRADERLTALGLISKKTRDGVTVADASIDGEVRAGYALKGRCACAISHPSAKAAQALLQEAQRRVAKSAGDVPSLPGVALAWARSGSWSAQASASTLTLHGRSRLPLIGVKSTSPSPYGGIAPSGLFFARAQVEPGSIPGLVGVLESQIDAVCPGCNRAELSGLSSAFAPLLTGHVLLRVDRLDARDPLRTTAGRYFALKHAYLAEVTDPAAVAALLPRVLAQKGAHAEDHGYALDVPGGQIHIGVSGRSLFIANDPAALAAALQPAKPQKLAHGAEWFLDPKLGAKALRQISLFDVMSSQELASVFAAGTELGPLLGITDRVSGWLDGSGDVRGDLEWTLSP